MVQQQCLINMDMPCLCIYIYMYVCVVLYIGHSVSQLLSVGCASNTYPKSSQKDS